MSVTVRTSAVCEFRDNGGKETIKAIKKACRDV